MWNKIISLFSRRKNTANTERWSEVLVSETDDTLEFADLLTEIDQKEISNNLVHEILKSRKDLGGLPKPSDKISIMQHKHALEAGHSRRKAITTEEEGNPRWIEASLLESFLFSYPNLIKQNTGFYIRDRIIKWIEKNTSEKDGIALIKKHMLGKDLEDSYIDFSYPQISGGLLLPGALQTALA